MKQFVCFFCFTISTLTYAQLQRSTISVSGSTSEIVQNSKTFYVSESVGQQSVIGTHFNESITARQGYQQPPIQVMVIAEAVSSLDAIVYPNPVENLIHLTLNDNISGDMLLLIYDIQGKEVIRNRFNATRNLQQDLSHLASGNYLLKIIAKQKQFSAKLIKK